VFVEVRDIGVIELSVAFNSCHMILPNTTHETWGRFVQPKRDVLGDLVAKWFAKAAPGGFADHLMLLQGLTEVMSSQILSETGRNIRLKL
jgi:hypothetical protein